MKLFEKNIAMVKQEEKIADEEEKRPLAGL